MRKKTWCIFGALAGLLLLITGCASIINGRMQKVPINSTPDGGKATIYGAQNEVIYSATTPCTAELKRGVSYFKGSEYRVVIKKDGYDKMEIPLIPKVGGWYIGGNLSFGGLIGYLAVDPATGAMWTLTPKKIEAGLAGKHASLPGVN